LLDNLPRTLKMKKTLPSRADVASEYLTT